MAKSKPTPKALIFNSSSPSQPLSTFTDGLPLPKILVFDLDYTLWPFWVDTHVSPPVKARDGGRRIEDCLNESFTFYPSVPGLLLSLKGIATESPPAPILAIASRSSAPDLASMLLRRLLLYPHPPASDSDSLDSASTTIEKNSQQPPPRFAYEFFDHIEIFPGDKKRHFANIHKASGVAYEEMLFFDDEARNRNVEALGVVMLLVENGVSALEVDRGVREWRRRKGKEEKAAEKK